MNEGVKLEDIVEVQRKLGEMRASVTKGSVDFLVRKEAGSFPKLHLIRTSLLRCSDISLVNG
jgi:hypothetical protein